ncbi:hypothetical protein KAU32_04360 [bacterium]|nr:hypothetical protein [bacterium]
MNRKPILILIAVLFTAAIVTATIFDNTQPSAKAVGMGGGLTSYNAGVEGVFYNPATLFSVEDKEIFFCYKKPYSLSFMNESIFAAGYNLGKAGVVGLGYQGFTVGESGDALMSENTLIFSYANSFYSDRDATFNVGVSLKYMMLSFKDFGSASNVSFDFGILTKVGKNTYLGFSFKDINAPSFGLVDSQAIPAKMSFGVSYNPYYGTVTTLEVEKNEYEPARLHAGTELNIMKFLTLRMGIATQPSTINAGLTVKYSFVGVDYGMEYHNVLGVTHNFGFTLKF